MTAARGIVQRPGDRAVEISEVQKAQMSGVHGLQAPRKD
jgi:hypothetical protein